jgi:hypothetical protein
MAKNYEVIEGTVNGKVITGDAQTKIQSVLKTTLEQELLKETPTVGGVRPPAIRHGSVHGSVTEI